MRLLIAAVAFLIPVLIAFHFMASSVDTTGTPPAIGNAAIAELRTWLVAQDELVSYYAMPPGRPDSDSLPHLALDRFDRYGCDRHGNPWFRLAQRPPGIQCGVVRCTTAGSPLAPGRDQSPDLVLRLTDAWIYWEWREPPASVPSPPPRPASPRPARRPDRNPVLDRPREPPRCAPSAGKPAD